jgi:hypothetical protein
VWLNPPKKIFALLWGKYGVYSSRDSAVMHSLFITCKHVFETRATLGAVLEIISLTRFMRQHEFSTLKYMTQCTRHSQQGPSKLGNSTNRATVSFSRRDVLLAIACVGSSLHVDTITNTGIKIHVCLCCFQPSMHGAAQRTRQAETQQCVLRVLL